MSKILVSGGLVPTTKDTLLDARTRVATFSDIANIENPARFMVITVEDTGKKYEVKKLSSKIIGGIVVENSTIDINDPEALVDLGLAEELRSEEEKVRQSNEKKRIEAENLRKSAEDSRNVNETNRVSAEGVREASERTRVSSEETRNANEQTRNSNETKRQLQESTRQSQESARQNNESTRNTNESARKEAESKRKTEETSRRTAELSRSSAENERVKNEQNRTTAENTRSSAEDRRVANETQRTTNETARNNAELSREQAEGNRASTFNTLKGQMQTTIQEGQTAVAATEKATSDAQKVVDNYDTKVAEQDGKLSELGSEVDKLNLLTEGEAVYDVNINNGALANTGMTTYKRMINYIPVEYGDIVTFNIKRTTDNTYKYGYQGYDINKKLDGYSNYSPSSLEENEITITRKQVKYIRFEYSEVDSDGKKIDISNVSVNNSDFEVIVRRSANHASRISSLESSMEIMEQNISELTSIKKTATDDVITVLRKETLYEYPDRQGLTVDSEGKITYIVQPSDESVVIIDLTLKSAQPNPYTNGRYVNVRGLADVNSSVTLILVYYGSNNVPQNNQSFGVISSNATNKGYSMMISNAAQSSTAYIGIRLQINTGLLKEGDSVVVSDLSLTDHKIPDYRGVIVERDVITQNERIENCESKISSINDELDGKQKEVDITNEIISSYYPNTYQTRYGGSTGTMEGYSVSKILYNIEGVYKIEIYNTMQNRSTATSPILFFKSTNRVGNLVYCPLYHRPKKDVIYKSQWGDAKYIGLSWKDSLVNEFYVKLYYGDGVSFYENKHEIQYLNRLEDAVTLKSNAKIVNVGSFSMRRTDDIVGISHEHTQITGFTPIGLNCKQANPISVINTYNGLPYVYHIGKYSGKVYYNGGDGVYLNVADSMDDFLQGKGRRCCSDYILGIAGVREMSNLELVIITQLVNGNEDNCGILVTKDWASKMNTEEECTVEVRQKYLTARNSPQDAWGFHVCGGKILVSEYSPNVTPNTFSNNHVYYSNDFGKTFNVIYDIASQFGVPSERENPVSHQHIHGCCIDEYWNRLWVMPGESSVNDIALSYSDDEGETWVHLSTKAQEKVTAGSSYMWLKFCSAHALSTGVIFGTDAQPNSIWRFNRVSKQYEEGVTESQIEEVKRFDIGNDHNSTITHIMGHMTRVVGSSSEYPCVVCVPLVGSASLVSNTNETGIVYVTYDGIRFWEVWRETDMAYKAPDNFRDNNMKAYLFPNGKIYIFTSYLTSSGGVGSRIVEGFMDV